MITAIDFSSSIKTKTKKKKNKGVIDNEQYQQEKLYLQ